MKWKLLDKMAQITLPAIARYGRILTDASSRIYNSSGAANLTGTLFYNRAASWRNLRPYTSANTSNQSASDTKPGQPIAQDPTTEQDKLPEVQRHRFDDEQSNGERPAQSPEVESLLKDVSALKASLTTYEDKYKRALAESENVRRRMTKQVEEAKAFGIQSFCKDLLDVADTLSKAADSVPANELSDSDPQLKALHSGVALTLAQLQQVFSRHGLSPVDPIGHKFDPNMHEALFQQQVEGKETGTVIVVSKIGYKLHERCLRPALVGVAK